MRSFVSVTVIRKSGMCYNCSGIVHRNGFIGLASTISVIIGKASVLGVIISQASDPGVIIGRLRIQVISLVKQCYHWSGV